MHASRRPAISLYVDRRSPDHWVVRDHQGRFWTVPPGANAWDRREVFEPTDQAELEPVPGHYLYMIDIPVAS